MHRLFDPYRAAALLVVASIAGPAHGQSISRTQDLAFGGFAAGSGGTVTISSSGLRTASGDVTLLTSGQSSQFSPASFDVTGSAHATYSIILPANDTVTLTNAQNNSMSLTSFTSTPSGTGQLSAAGAQIVSVGSTLVVGNNQQSGSYTGSFTVTVTFQ